MKLSYLFLSYLVVLVVGCTGNGRHPATPAEVVETFITAWEAGDSQGMDEHLSQQGQHNVAAYCNGTVTHCLTDNYQGNGELQTYRAEVVEETAETAQIRLHTTWSAAGERCQTYELEKTEAGWQVTFFGRTRKCPESEGLRPSSFTFFL